MLGVWRAADRLHIAPDAGCWRVARLRIARSAVQLVERRVVSIAAKDRPAPVWPSTQPAV